jgi:hypothetical protein
MTRQCILFALEHVIYPSFTRISHPVGGWLVMQINFGGMLMNGPSYLHVLVVANISSAIPKCFWGDQDELSTNRATSGADLYRMSIGIQFVPKDNLQSSW